jgi:membrane-bound metal-dependent hydrolase YbcI (DUF457 family)
VIVGCAVAALSPDLDLLIPQAHRTVTHSIGAVAVVIIFAIVVTGRVTSHRTVDAGGRQRAVLAIVAAFASHLFLDWLAADPTAPRGLQLLWPINSRWYISGLDLFRGTARRNVFTWQSMWINATAITQEIALLGPIAWVVFRWRR